MANFNLAELFMDTVYADIIFVVDKKEIPGHRLVLAKSCDYFDKLLFGDFMESKSKKVEISGISAKVFQEVLRFIYKGQLEINEWSIEDLMSLLAVAHEYQLQPLFSAVINAVKRQPVDLDSWPLVSSAASVYDSEDLRRKCYSFAEEKIEDFIREKDLETFSAALICCMFERPQMSSFNQDLVVKSICKWKHGHSAAEVMCVLQKINWEKVSANFTAVVLRALLSTVNNVENHKFWKELSTELDGQYGSHSSIDRIFSVDSVVMKKDLRMKFAIPNIDSTLFCFLESNCIKFRFQKDFAWVEIPVNRIEFEASTKFKIESISGHYLLGGDTKAVAYENSANNGWFKYSGVFSDSKPLFCVLIVSPDFKNMAEISLRNIIIQ